VGRSAVRLEVRLAAADATWWCTGRCRCSRRWSGTWRCAAAGRHSAQVSDVLRRTAGPLLERLEVFDEYRGPGIPAGHRSVAWHCSFRDPERTLR